MKRTFSAVALATLATLASAQAQADVQPSFVDFTVLPTERAKTAISDANLLSAFPQPSSIAN